MANRRGPLSWGAEIGGLIHLGRGGRKSKSKVTNLEAMNEIRGRLVDSCGLDIGLGAGIGPAVPALALIPLVVYGFR